MWTCKDCGIDMNTQMIVKDSRDCYDADFPVSRYGIYCLPCFALKLTPHGSTDSEASEPKNSRTGGWGNDG